MFGSRLLARARLRRFGVKVDGSIVRFGELRLAFARLLTVACKVLFAAPSGGFMSGVVRERSGTLVSDVEVRIQSEFTGAQQKVFTNENGKFVSSALMPGMYRVVLRHGGFRTGIYNGLTVQAGRTQNGDFVIELLPLQQEVTVESASDATDPAANGVAVSRHSSERTLPANGRDLHAYYAVMPGAVLTPAASSDGGQFTVNGQRPNTNTVRLDGVNANTGVGLSGLPGTYPGSSLPAMTAFGSTQSITSEEEIDRAELRSSDFAPETGGRPGAQILIETRSGSNAFHGSAFGLLRPATLDSTDWLAKHYQVLLKASSLTGYGASLGGALIPNRTFFFLALEREDLRDTAMQLMAVPSLAARAKASSKVGLLLNAFPLPTGPSLGTNTALAATPLRQRASVENYSARVDQMVGDKARIFARYVNVPSRSLTQQLGTINASLPAMSAILGLTGTWSGAVHDFRANFTRAMVTASWTPTAGNAQAAFDAFPFRTGSSAMISASGGVSQYHASGIAALSIAGVGQLFAGTAERTYQNQWSGTYTLSKQRGRHETRFGGDYVRLLPTTLGSQVGSTSAVSAGIAPLLAGVPLGLAYTSGRPFIFNEPISIGSAFLQDTFHVNERLSILYGSRWEVTPPTNRRPSETYLSSIGNWAGPNTLPNEGNLYAKLGRSTWPMSYTQLAPRVGVAYRLHRPAIVFRAGAGNFYETALGSLINPVNLPPLNASQFVPSTSLTVPPTVAFIETTPPALSLPRTWQWRLSAERAFGDRSVLSLAYVGSAGSRLLRLEGTVDDASGVLEQTYFTSYGAAEYQGFQAQFRGNLRPNLYALVSWGWGHSMDNGSQGSAVYFAGPGYSPSVDRASSDFDVRHHLSASFSYRVTPRSAGAWGSLLKNWTLSSTVDARTGFPFNVTTIDRSIGLGFANTARPDLVSGQPVWISGDSSSGGKKLNPRAFQSPAGSVNGNLGRNVLTGPGLFQIDASLRRQFRLFGATSLETSFSAFNLLNRVSFANPVSYLGSPLFGRAASMQNLMLGSGNPTNGLAPLFQPGGPRTVEMKVKISF